MGGIVSIKREKSQRNLCQNMENDNEHDSSLYYSCNSSQKAENSKPVTLDVRRLSFPMQNQLSKHEVDVIEEEKEETDTFENDGTRHYSRQQQQQWEQEKENEKKDNKKYGNWNSN